MRMNIIGLRRQTLTKFLAEAIQISLPSCRSRRQGLGLLSILSRAVAIRSSNSTYPSKRFTRNLNCVQPSVMIGIEINEMKLFIDCDPQPITVALSKEKQSNELAKTVDSLFGALRNRNSLPEFTVVIYNNGFDPLYRLKKSVQFSFDLDNVSKQLKAQSICHWPLHCTTAEYQQENQDAIKRPRFALNKKQHYV